MIQLAHDRESSPAHSAGPWMRAVAGAMFCFFLLLQSTQLVAQATGNSLSRARTVRISAVVQGSLSINVKNIPLRFNLFDPDDPGGKTLVFPVSTTWNVNPQEVRSVELIGYFSDRSRALSSEDGTTVAASDVKGRLNGGAFNCFDQSNVGGPLGGSMRLFSERIDRTNSRRTRTDNLELQVDTVSHPNLSKSIYSGVLILEVRQF